MRTFFTCFLALCMLVIVSAFTGISYSPQKAKAGFCTDQGVPVSVSIDAVTVNGISFAQPVQIINTDHYLPFPNEGNKKCQESTVICTCENRFMLNIKDWSIRINSGYDISPGKTNKKSLLVLNNFAKQSGQPYDHGWKA
jgi:hypothetical protein